MQLRDLQIFVDIVEAGGLTAAAVRRGVTQPALSRLLRDMETRLRAQLLRRTGRGIELTPAGAEFHSFASETLQNFETTKARVAERAKSMPTTLRLSVPMRLGRVLIPELYRTFGHHLPDTTLLVVEEPTERARVLLGKGALDLAVTYRAVHTSDADFLPLFSEDLFAAGHARDLGRERVAISLTELSTMPLLLPSAGPYRGLVDAAFRGAGYDIHPARGLETTEGMLAFAMEGEGIAILPRSNIYPEIARSEICACPIGAPAITRQIGLVLGPQVTAHAARSLQNAVRDAMGPSAQAAGWTTVPRPRPRRNT